MKYAVVIFPTAYSIGIVELARAAEERGFDALFLPEHTHIPVSRRSPFPGGGELPRHHLATLDPLISLATAAGVTSKLKLGTSVCLVVERDPIVLAKEIATLDVLSGGRVILGVGAGWNAEEMEDHGVRFNVRRKVLREKIEAMKAIWTEPQAQYHGEFVNFDPMWCDPKPVQKPHPPILMGGRAPAAMRAAIRFADGWMPGGSIPEPARIFGEFRAMAAAAGRDPNSLSLNLSNAPADRKALEVFAKLGVERATFPLPSDGREAALRKLDEYAALIEH